MAGSRIIQSAIAAARKTIFAPPRVTQPFDDRTVTFKRGKAVDHGHQIKNWLGTDTRDGRRANMMHSDDRVTSCCRKTHGFLSRIFRPGGIMLFQFDGDGSRHFLPLPDSRAFQQNLKIDQGYGAGVDRFSQENLTQMGEASGRIGCKESGWACVALMKQGFFP